MFVCGGECSFGRDVWLMTVWCLDTRHGSWHEAGILSQPRRHHGICSYGTSFFLMGGIGRYRIRLRTMESFNTETGGTLYTANSTKAHKRKTDYKRSLYYY